MNRPLLLDLFCGAGGAATGYHRAGFDVVGVDLEPQPRYPFHFIQADALAFVAEHGWEYDVIHASPPCQAHTPMSNRWRGKGGRADEHTDLIPATRAALKRTKLPYIIENVVGARKSMDAPIILRGDMFGLGVDRPRCFESNAVLLSPKRGKRVQNPLGVYGDKPDGRRLATRKDGSIQRAPKGLEEARVAMGIDWMEWRELAESIPPAYTEFLGRQLLEACEEALVA